MEEIYLKGRANLPKPSSCFSRKVTFRTRFKEYSQELGKVLKDRKPEICDMYKAIFLDHEILTDEFLEDCSKIKREFNISTIDLAESNNSVPSTSEDHSTLDTKIGVASSSKVNVSPKGRRDEDINFIEDNSDSNGEDLSCLESLNASIKKKRTRRRRKKSVKPTGTHTEPFLPPETRAVNNLNSTSARDCLGSSKRKTTKEIYDKPVISHDTVGIVSKLLESTNIIQSNTVTDQDTNKPQTITDLKENLVKRYPFRRNKNIVNHGSRGTIGMIHCEDIEESSTKTLMIQESTDIKKTPVRYSTRKKRDRSNIQSRLSREAGRSKFEETQDVVRCDDSTALSQLELLDNPLLYVRKEMKEVMNRGTKIKKRSHNRRDVSVDTTKRLGKKDLIPWENFVISFRVHKPFKHLSGIKGARTGRFDAEIEVLNYQSLSDLRKRIQCEADYQDICGDVSDCLDKPKILAMDEYKAGMFYIDNTFYVDTQPGAEDYSVLIKEWAEERGINLGSSVPMDTKNVEDLEIRLGYPYVYMHQGMCEHLVIISSARFLTPKDSLHSSDYPNLVKVSRSRMEYCCCCSKTPASWIVSKTDRMFYDYNKMCDLCFESYHYKNGEKIGNFKAHRYAQRGILFS